MSCLAASHHHHQSSHDQINVCKCKALREHVTKYFGRPCSLYDKYT